MFPLPSSENGLVDGNMEAAGLEPAIAESWSRERFGLLLDEIRSLARSYQPGEPGDPGHEVEGRVIASDLYALADWYDPRRWGGSHK